MLATLSVIVDSNSTLHKRKKSRSPGALTRPFSDSNENTRGATPLLAALPSTSVIIEERKSDLSPNSSPTTTPTTTPPLSPAEQKVEPKFLFSAPSASSQVSSQVSSPVSSTASSSTSSFSSFFNDSKRTQFTAERLESAEKALAENNLAEACRIYQQILTDEPHHTKTLYRHAQALTQLKKIPEAIATYEKLLKLTPRYTRAIAKLTALLYAEKRLAEAENWGRLISTSFTTTTFNNFKSIKESGDPNLLLIQGEFFLVSGKPEEAQKCRTQILDLLGDDENLARIYLDAFVFAVEEPPQASYCLRLLLCCC